MLIKFYSEESAPFVMFDSVASQLLTIMGHADSREGSVSAEALDSALNRLVQGIANEEGEVASAHPNDCNEPQEVSLSARAAPLIAMLRRASEAGGYVMWHPD